jgi:hypothetical protein
MHHGQPILTAAAMSARSLIFTSNFFHLAALCSNVPNAWIEQFTELPPKEPPSIR